MEFLRAEMQRDGAADGERADAQDLHAEDVRREDGPPRPRPEQRRRVGDGELRGESARDEEETGQHVGFRVVSNIRLARTKDRWDEFMYYAGVAETIGVKVNRLTPQQVKESWPLFATKSVSAMALGAPPVVAEKFTVPEPLPPVRFTVIVIV